MDNPIRFTDSPAPDSPEGRHQVVIVTAVHAETGRTASSPTPVARHSSAYWRERNRLADMVSEPR